MVSPPSARKRRREAALSQQPDDARRRWSPLARGLAVLALVLALVGAVWGWRALTFDPAERGRAALLAGDARSARVDLTAALQTQPRNPGLHRDLALAQLALGRAEEAERNLSRAAELGLPRAALTVHFARARLLRRDPQAALALIDAIPHQTPPALILRGDALRMTDDPLGADAAYRRAIEAGGGEAAWVALGRLRLAEEDMLGADAAADAARRSPGSGVAARLFKADVVTARGGPVSGLPWYRAALAQAPEDVPTLVSYAAALGEAGRGEAAVDTLRRAADLDPGNPRIAYLRAVLAIRGGEPALARALLARAGIGAAGEQLLRSATALTLRDDLTARNEALALMRAAPGHRDACRLLALAVARSGASGDAIALLDPLTTRRDADSWSLLLLARMAEAYGQPLAAIEPRARAASGTRGDADVLRPDDAPQGGVGLEVAAIRAALRDGDAGRAAARASELSRRNPGVAEAAILVGDVARQTGDFAGAVAAYTRAAELRFDRAAAMRLVEAQLASGRRDAARTTLAEYLARWPEDASATKLAGNFAAEDGDWGAAAGAYSAAIARLGTNDALLDARYARALTEIGRVEDALPFAERAYRLMPMSAATSSIYGRVLALGGARPRDAADLLGKARQLDPDDPVIARWARDAGF